MQWHKACSKQSQWSLSPPCSHPGPAQSLRSCCVILQRRRPCRSTPKMAATTPSPQRTSAGQGKLVMTLATKVGSPQPAGFTQHHDTGLQTACAVVLCVAFVAIVKVGTDEGACTYEVVTGGSEKKIWKRPKMAGIVAAKNRLTLPDGTIVPRLPTRMYATLAKQHEDHEELRAAATRVRASAAVYHCCTADLWRGAVFCGSGGLIRVPAGSPMDARGSFR